VSGLEDRLERIAEARGADAAWDSMGMGGGSRLEPEFDDEGNLTNGTMYEGCPKSPDGYHHFSHASCVQSVDHHVCDHCGYGVWD
jgi:hypothetical protein